MKHRLLCIVGTRPEAIKMAPVIAALRKRYNSFDCLVCLTAQHRAMVDQIMAVSDLTADFDLDLMREGQSPAELAGRILRDLPRVLRTARPDMVVVQGDTTTTMAAALTAFMERVPVAHVEAGLRTGDLLRPFPEEANRRLASVVATLHFAPTTGARDALLREGVPADRIRVTGNTVIDALLSSIDPGYELRHPALQQLPEDCRLVLVTVHRRESFGAPLEGICRAVAALADEFRDARIVLPVHRNPMVRNTVETVLGGHPNVILTEPLDYLEFVHVMAKSRIVLTDSGGVQEEAPSLGKPVLVMREVTERPEGVEAGTARLVGADPDRIVAEARLLLTDQAEYDRVARIRNPYGDGHASDRIADVLAEWFGRLPAGNTSP